MAQGTGVSAGREGRSVEGEGALRWPAALGTQAEGEAIEVALLWGERTVELRQFRAGEVATIGHGAKDSLHLFSRWVGAGFVLLRGGQRGRVVRIPEGGRVALYTGESAWSQASLEREGRLAAGPDGDALELELRAGERAVVGVGALRLAVRPVTPPARIGAFVPRELDFSFFKLATITALAAIALLLGLLAPDGEDEVIDDGAPLRLPASVVKSVVVGKPPPPKVPETKLPAVRGPAAPPRAQRGAGPRGKGRGGAADLLAGLRAMSGPGLAVFEPGFTEVDVALKRLVAGGPSASTWGIDGPRGGPPAGPGIGMSWGGPLGPPGGGGGGGRPDGITFPGGGGPGGTLRPKVSSVPEKTVVVGGLDRDQIAKVIDGHQREIKHCYESALNRDPELHGKVAVMFTIGADGAVIDAQLSEVTLESPGAQACILARLQRWRFPQPRGGGQVTVNYPWLFRPAGAQ